MNTHLHDGFLLLLFGNQDKFSEEKTFLKEVSSIEMRRVNYLVKVKTPDHAHPFFGEESSARKIYVTRIFKRMKTAGTMGPGELIEDASNSGVAGFFYCRQMSELVRAERREEPLHRPLDGLQIRND